MIAGRVRAALDAALVSQAALALEKQLLALAAALLALGTGVTGHQTRLRFLGRQPLWAWGVTSLTPGHLEAGGLERTDRRLATGPGALDEHLDLLQAVLDALAGGGVGGHLGGERSRLARALEARAASRLPGDHVALAIGQRDDRVVERGLDVRLPDRDVLAHAAPAALWSTRCWHYFLAAFFLPATCIRLGPLRVRALVFVFWPRTGRPRRWRRPR